MLIGYALGWINTRLILGLIFFFVLQPTALIMRLFNYDPLKKRKDDTKASYKEDRSNHQINLKKIF